MAVELTAPAPEQTRARYPDESGYVERDGVRALLGGLRRRASRPSCSCRRGRSSTRATGRCRSRTSRGTAAWSRSTGAATAARTDPRAEAYEETEFAADALAVMDATATESAVLVSALAAARQRACCSRPSSRSGSRRRLHLPLRAAGAAACRARSASFDEELDTDEGWAKYNRHYWLRDYGGFLEFFFSQMFTEPHSTKPIEDGVGWGARDDARSPRRTTSAGDGLAEAASPRALSRAFAARCS